MLGRDQECEAIEGLLDAARFGRGGALVLHGDPGVGKTTLLGHAAVSADEMRRLRCTGTTAERDLPYAALHQMLRPVLERVGDLPTSQAEHLRGALGVTARRGTDRLLVGAAVLDLLSRLADDQPVLCLVDDLHLVDPATTDVLGFVARRLETECVALLAATRHTAPGAMPSFQVDGLDNAAAHSLVRSLAPELEPDSVERLVTETGGNPLALAELAESLPPDRIRDPAPWPLPDRTLAAFTDRLRGLSNPTRRLLLTAAADDTGDLAVIARAAEAIGAPAAALDAAVRAGLVDLDGTERLTFRHPLLRSALYYGAEVTDRLAVHRALADAVDGQVDQRVRHLAASSLGADEGVADDLLRWAREAEHRGGPALASAAYEHCASQTTDRAGRGRCLAAGAESACAAGEHDRAAALAEQAAELTDEALVHARLTAVRGTIDLRRGSAITAQPLLVEAARQLASLDPELAIAVLAEAAWAAESRADPRHLVQVLDGLAGLKLPPGDRLQPLVTTFLGFRDFLTAEVDAGVQQIRQGIDRIIAQIQCGEADYLEQVTLVEEPALALGDHEAALFLSRSEVAMCQARGLDGRMPFALAGLAHTETHAGQYESARAHVAEAMRRARELEQDPVICFSTAILAFLAAIRGDRDECLRRTDEATRLAEACEFTVILNIAPWWLGLLDLSTGESQSALDRILDVVAMGTKAWVLADPVIVPDLVEAAARAGRPEDAREHLARYERWALAVGQPWAEAVLSRSRALVAADDEETEAHFATAVRSHASSGHRDRPFERARTQLLYGEWLRRTSRRIDARTQLAAAQATFDRLAATSWATRAAAELRATGQTVRRRGRGTVQRLTPQELNIVRMAAQGGSNKEIAAQLYLSPRTVGYHLSNAFPKLGVASRRELVRLDLDALSVDD